MRAMCHMWCVILCDLLSTSQARPTRKRNKLPKLYAIWTGATRPEGRKVKIDKIVDNWAEAHAMVFKVAGANYCSATNNAAGRKQLEPWLQIHRDMGSSTRVLL